MACSVYCLTSLISLIFQWLGCHQALSMLAMVWYQGGREGTNDLNPSKDIKKNTCILELYVKWLTKNIKKNISINFFFLKLLFYNLFGHSKDRNLRKRESCFFFFPKIRKMKTIKKTSCLISLKLMFLWKGKHIIFLSVFTLQISFENRKIVQKNSHSITDH